MREIATGKKRSAEMSELLPGGNALRAGEENRRRGFSQRRPAEARTSAPDRQRGAGVPSNQCSMRYRINADPDAPGHFIRSGAAEAPEMPAFRTPTSVQSHEEIVE